MAGAVPVRPSDEGCGWRSAAEFFDHVWRLPLFQRLKNVVKDELAFLEAWREFPRFTRTGAVVEGTAAFAHYTVVPAWLH